MLGMPMTRGWVSVAVSTTTQQCGEAAMQAREIMRPFPDFEAVCLPGGEKPDGPMSVIIR